MMNRKPLGVSILELMVATTVLAVALVMVLSVLISAMRLDNQTHEMSLAKQQATFKLEQMRGFDYTTLVGMVTGAGGNYTEDFDVQGLSAQEGDPDGRCGHCLISSKDEAGVLLDPSGNNNLLRIHVRIDWRSRGGSNQSFDINGLRSDRGANWTGN